MKKKEFYTAPELEELEFRLEEALLVGSLGSAGGDDETEDLGDLT